MGVKHREKIDVRTPFNCDEKQLMLNKSKSKCAICGKPLTVYTMTAEHVIPLSKGGINDMSNMIALCQTCNGEKDNFILAPQSCYKYLNKSILKDLSKLFDNYVRNTNWLSFTNMLPADVDIINAPRIIINKSATNMYYQGVKISRIDMRKTSDSVDIVKRRVAEWNSKYMSNPESVDEYIDGLCNKCTFYLIGSSLETGIILPVSIELHEFDDSIGYSKYSDYSVTKEHYMLKFWNPIMDVDNIHLCMAVGRAVTYISGIIQDKASENNIGIIPVAKVWSPANTLYHNVLQARTNEDLYNVWKNKSEILSNVSDDLDEFSMDFCFQYSDRFTESIQNSDEDTRWILTEQELIKFDRFIQKYCTKNEDYYE